MVSRVLFGHIPLPVEKTYSKLTCLSCVVQIRGKLVCRAAETGHEHNRGLTFSKSSTRCFGLQLLSELKNSLGIWFAETPVIPDLRAPVWFVGWVYNRKTQPCPWHKAQKYLCFHGKLKLGGERQADTPQPRTGTKHGSPGKANARGCCQVQSSR